MSMSLRDQLLQVGLISQKQAKDAERQEQRQKHPPKHHGRAAPPAAPPVPPPSARAAQQKTARDQALNRRQQEKAKKKALQAQIKQLIEQNRLPQAETDETYNFVDGNKIRRIRVSAAARGPLTRGEIVIVRNSEGYDLVPAAIAARIRERDAASVIASIAQDSSPADEAYKEFAVPDDLIW